MPRTPATEPIPTGKKALPWMFPIPASVRHLHGDKQRKYFRKRGDCLLFIRDLRHQRTGHTAAFNLLPDTQKAQAHEAIQMLAAYPGAASLVDLARAEVARLDVAARSKPLAPLILELLAEKKTDGRRERYLTGLRGMLNVFAAAFPDRLASSITAQEITAWLRDNYANPNSRDSYRRNISVLFTFAKAKNYVAANPVRETQAVNARREDEVPILKPDELTALLIAASPRLRPYIVICAFAALRPTEAQRITWEHVSAQGIYVPKSITKTVARYVPVVSALAEWLEYFGPQKGKVFPRAYRTWRKDFEAARKAAGLFEGWEQDALRHSAISYWLAVHQDRAAVAKWSGNSESVQTQHYDNPRSAVEAAAWYAVLPGILENKEP